MDYHDRLNEVNAACNDADKTVWDSIDRPIRPLIYELNRIGLRTKFSCCGFSYDGEEEPKSHHRSFSYAFMYPPKSKMGQHNLREVRNFVKAVKRDNNWKLGITKFGKNEHLVHHLWIGNHVKGLYKVSDGLEKSIHDYEVQVLAIHLLTKGFKELATDQSIEEIVDGNKSYHDQGITEWQVKPKQTVGMMMLKEQYDSNKEIKDFVILEQ